MNGDTRLPRTVQVLFVIRAHFLVLVLQVAKPENRRSRLIMWGTSCVMAYIMALLPTQPLFSTGSGGLGLDNTRGWGLAAGAWGAQRCTVHSILQLCIRLTLKAAMETQQNDHLGQSQSRHL